MPDDLLRVPVRCGRRYEQQTPARVADVDPRVDAPHDVRRVPRHAVAVQASPLPDASGPGRACHRWILPDGRLAAWTAGLPILRARCGADPVRTCATLSACCPRHGERSSARRRALISRARASSARTWCSWWRALAWPPLAACIERPHAALPTTPRRTADTMPACRARRRCTASRPLPGMGARRASRRETSARCARVSGLLARFHVMGRPSCRVGGRVGDRKWV